MHQKYLLTASLMLIIASFSINGQTTFSRGNLLRIRFDQKNINTADTLGVWTDNWQKDGNYFSYDKYYDHFSTPVSSYFLKKSEYYSSTQWITWMEGKLLIENEVSLNSRQFGITGIGWDVLGPYMFEQTRVIETKNGHWLINGAFRNSFIYNNDSLYILKPSYSTEPNQTMSDRLAVIMGKVNDKYLAAFWKKYPYNGDFDYLLISLDHSPYIDSTESVKVKFTGKSNYDSTGYYNRNAITYIRNIKGDLYLVKEEYSGGLDIFRFKDSTFYYVKSVLSEDFWGGHFITDSWEFSNGKLYYFNRRELTSFEFRGSDTTFINRKVLLDSLDYSFYNITTNIGIDRDFRYAAKIFRNKDKKYQDTLKILDIEKETFISSVCLENIKDPFRPVVDSPYVYIHQLRDQHTGIAEDNKTNIVRAYSLSAYPNPFNASVKITYTLPEDNNVELNIYDLLGRKIETLVKGPEKTGSHEAIFNAAHLSSGIYLYTLSAGRYMKTNKLILIK